MSQRLSDEQMAAIKAQLERDPYANIPERAFRKAGAFRPKLDDVPVELKRADIRALLADLEEAREHRRILREALQRLEWAGRWQSDTGEWFNVCPDCGRVRRIGHYPDCNLSKALAATEEEKADGPS